MNDFGIRLCPLDASNRHQEDVANRAFALLRLHKRQSASEMTSLKWIWKQLKPLYSLVFLIPLVSRSDSSHRYSHSATSDSANYKLVSRYSLGFDTI